MRIPVSYLGRYEFCPMTIYLSDVLKLESKPTPEQIKGVIGHTIRKEISLRQARLLGRIQRPEEIEFYILGEIENILNDIPHIYRDKLGDIEYEKYLSNVSHEIQNEIKIMSEKLEAMVTEIGITDALKRLTPWRVEYSIRSDKLRLSGRIDKVMKDETYIPVEIKTGNASDGVWEGDRLQICAYAMLLEDKFGLRKAIPFGFVEYTRIQERRPVMMTEQLRRRVINTRDEIIEILNGRIPEIPHDNEKKCESCSYRDRCHEIRSEK